MPTRRSSRLRNAAVEAPAAEATESISASLSAPATASPASRCATRQNSTPAVPAAADESARVDASTDTVPEMEDVVVNIAEDEIVSDEPSTDGPANSTPQSEDLSFDAFEQALRAFGGTRLKGMTPAEASVPSLDEAPGFADVTAHLAVRRSRRVRKAVTLGATVGVMSLAGLLVVSMTLPAEALAAVQGTPVASTSLVAAPAEKNADADDEIQAFVTSSDVQNEALDRADQFSTMSLVDVAAEQGINYSNEIFTNDPEAAIQWPFLVGVGMSYGYGMRSGRLHEGIDFVPGNGAPVQAIADGTVRIATEQGGAYGVTVYIDHVIDGEVITSHYSHMQYGSLQVAAGDTVTVGTVIGKTGNTGRSYGAHMHFELIVNGSTIDPLPWLRENAGRYSY